MKEPLQLKHKELLYDKLKSLHLCLSEYSFVTLYLYRHKYHLHLLSENHTYWIQGKLLDGKSYLMPTEDISHFDTITLKKMLKETHSDYFYPIPEKWLGTFSQKTFSFESSRSDADYLFTRKSIAQLSGRSLSAKRNLLKQFLDNYKAEVFYYEKKYLADALSVLKQWQQMDADSDYEPCQEALHLADELQLSGLIIYIEKKPVAFILGETLGKSLYDIHFAKALKEYKGIYTFLFKELALRLSSTDIRCLNWEQDLGVEGLRQSKLSFQPDVIANKFKVRVQESQLG